MERKMKSDREIADTYEKFIRQIMERVSYSDQTLIQVLASDDKLLGMSIAFLEYQANGNHIKTQDQNIIQFLELQNHKV